MKRELSKANVLQGGPPSIVVMATCVDSEGRPNIITLGMYMPISSNPPLVCIGVSPKRFSHRLIEETGEFVVNIPSIDLKEEMHFCGTKSGKDFDKFRETGLTPMPALKVKPPLIDECYGHLKCKVVQSYVCGDHTLFVGKIVSASADDDVLEGERVNLLKARPIVQKNHVYFTVSDKK